MYLVSFVVHINPMLKNKMLMLLCLTVFVGARIAMQRKHIRKRSTAVVPPATHKHSTAVVPLATHKHSTAVVPAATHNSCVNAVDNPSHSFAYLFVVHDSQYKRAAQTIRAQIMALDGNVSDFVVSLVPQRTYLSFSDSLRSSGWKVLPYCELPGPSGIYSYSLHKTRAFQLTQYKRVCHLDADMSVVRSIHHLFHFPAAPIIGAWSYWDTRPSITGPLWIASPSDERWRRIWVEFYRRRNENANDMSVINSAFGHSIPKLCPDAWGNGIRIFPQGFMLPYFYMVLDSDFAWG